MKIVVTVKQVPDPNSTQALESDNTLARDKEVVLDPGDECGIEEGLQLKEAHGGEVWAANHIKVLWKMRL